MAGFANARKLADAESAGQYLYASFRKQATQTTGAGIWFDLSMSPGNPAPNYYIGSPNVKQLRRGAALAPVDTAIKQAAARKKRSAALRRQEEEIQLLSAGIF